MSSNLHRVRRLRLGVRVGSAAQAFETRRELRSRLDVDLLPALAKALDTVDVGGRVVRIPRLNIHLRLKSGDDLTEAVSFALESELRRALAGESIDSSSLAEIRRLPSGADLREALVDYLRTGRLPWRLATDLDAAPPSDLVLKEAADALVDEFGTTFVIPGASLKERTAAAFRWLQLLSEPRRAEVLNRVKARERTGSLRSVELIRRLLSEADAASPVGERLNGLLVALRDDDLVPAKRAEIVVRLSEILAVPPRRIAVEIGVDPVIPPEWSGVPERASTSARSDDASASPETVSGVPPRPAIQFLSASSLHDDRPATVDDGTPAEDAGLVLLHPYLPRLFAAVGIRLDGRMIHKADAPKAASLLHWTATGSTPMFEYQLTLSKLLAGSRPDDVLLVGSNLLRPSDRDEADAMLSAAIRHWGVLGNTSPNGFRASFLKRRGLLWESADGWRLRIEPRGHDVLVGRLPWGFNVVRLAWMNRPIFTDWPTP